MGRAYTLIIHPDAEADLAALQEKHRRQVDRRIQGLAGEPRPVGARPLKGAKAQKRALWRIRSGVYRIIYQIRDAELIVLGVRVGSRKNIYREL
mgnify:CR=1 FL=1